MPPVTSQQLPPFTHSSTGGYAIGYYITPPTTKTMSKPKIHPSPNSNSNPNPEHKIQYQIQSWLFNKQNERKYLPWGFVREYHVRCAIILHGIHSFLCDVRVDRQFLLHNVRGNKFCTSTPLGIGLGFSD